VSAGAGPIPVAFLRPRLAPRLNGYGTRLGAALAGVGIGRPYGLWGLLGSWPGVGIITPSVLGASRARGLPGEGLSSIG
jgi:hypothetical protein